MQGLQEGCDGDQYVKECSSQTEVDRIEKQPDVQTLSKSEFNAK